MQNLSIKQQRKQQRKSAINLIQSFFIGNSAGNVCEVLSVLVAHFLENPDDWTEEFRNKAVTSTNEVNQLLIKLQELKV